MDLSFSSPLYFLANAHLLLAGPVLGLVGVALLRLRGTKGWRPLGWVVGAKAGSTALAVFPLSVAFAGWLPRLLGPDPLGRLPWLGLAFLGALLVVSTLAEWPCFHRASSLRGPWASLALSLRANTVSLLLVIAAYLPTCELSLLGVGTASAPPRDPSLQVHYLRDGALWRRAPGGAEARLGAVPAAGDARLFARRGAAGWDLWLQSRDEAPRSVREAVAPPEAQAPSQDAHHVRLKQGTRTAEAALPETWGRPAELVAEADSAWTVRLGARPGEGVCVASRDLRGAHRLALDTPLLSWEARCATRLPGERLLFQMGPYLWLLDLETRRLQCFAKGQGAQVIRVSPGGAGEGAAGRHSNAASCPADSSGRPKRLSALWRAE